MKISNEKIIDEIRSINGTINSIVRKLDDIEDKINSLKG